MSQFYPQSGKLRWTCKIYMKASPMRALNTQMPLETDDYMWASGFIMEILNHYWKTKGMPYWQWSCSIILLWNHHIFIQNAVTKSYLWLKYKFTVFDLIWSNRLQTWLNCTKPFCIFPQVKILMNLNAQWKPEVAASNHHTFLCANYIRNNFLHDPSYLGKITKHFKR